MSNSDIIHFTVWFMLVSSVGFSLFSSLFVVSLVFLHAASPNVSLDIFLQ